MGYATRRDAGREAGRRRGVPPSSSRLFGRKEGGVGASLCFPPGLFPSLRCAAPRRGIPSPPLPSLGPGYESTTTPASICLLGALGAGGVAGTVVASLHHLFLRSAHRRRLAAGGGERAWSGRRRRRRRRRARRVEGRRHVREGRPSMKSKTFPFFLAARTVPTRAAAAAAPPWRRGHTPHRRQPVLLLFSFLPPW
jgi:hypothetical protein